VASSSPPTSASFKSTVTHSTSTRRGTCGATSRAVSSSSPTRGVCAYEFVGIYNPADRHDRRPTWSEKTPEGRWRAYDYEDLLGRDKVNLDLFWLRDESLEDAAGLPEPDVIAEEIAEDLQSALDQFAAIANDLRPDR